MFGSMRQMNKEFSCVGCDNQYYNITIPHQGSSRQFTLAQQTRNNTVPILENPDEYQVAVSRLSIPVSNLPIFVAEPIVPLSNELVYNVSLEYNGEFQTVSLQYIPSTLGLSPTEDGYYYVYTYSRFVDWVNTALTQAFNDLSSKPMGSQPPYFTFNAETQLFSLHAQTAYYDETLATPIKIYGNADLLDKLDGFDGTYNFEPLLNINAIFQYRIYDKKNNIDGTHYVMTQDYNVLSRWNSLKSIQITSNLPINNEFVDTDYDDATGKATKSENILRDFAVFYNEFSSVARTTVDFQVDEFNYIDLLGHEPLRNIQINLYWLDQQGKRRPIYIRKNEAVFIKLMFKKKE